MAKTSRYLGFKLIRLQVQNPGELVDKNAIKKALESQKPKLLYICHGDTTSGTLQPLRGIGALCHQNDCLFMVDVSATVCCAPFAMDGMDIDVVISDTHHALAVPPGLVLLSFNNRSTKVIKSRKTDKISYSMNFDLLVQSWGLADDPKIIYHYTPSVSLLYALRESLAMVSEEGLEHMIERHMKFSLIAQKEITKIGLRFLAEDEQKRLTSVLVIIVPDAIRRDAVVEYMFRYYDIAISDGISPIDKVWRIGIFGQNASRRPIKLLTTVLREALEVAKRMATKGSNSLESPSSFQ